MIQTLRDDTIGADHRRQRRSNRRGVGRGLIVLLPVIAFVLSGCDRLPKLDLFTSEIASPEDAIRHIDKRVRREMRRLDIPGMAIAVIDDQDTLWEAYYGVENEDTGRRTSAETIFRAGSISKVFTALEVMRLRDEGLLDLDSPIEAYIPSFEVQRLFESTDPITVRSLLAHRSGLPRNGTLPLWYWDPGTRLLEELVGSLRDAYAVAPPWTRYKYSNIGYVTLGLLIEKLRGGLWPYYMQRELLQPMGMESSAFLSERLPADHSIATGYFPAQDGNAAGAERDIIYMPSGNLHTTVEDLASFMRFLFRGGRTEDTQLVEASTLLEMYQPDYATAQDPQRNGLGWFTDDTYLGEHVVFHDGTNDGTISYFAMIPGRKLGVVVCATSNAFESIHYDFVFDALDALRQGIYGIERAEQESSSDTDPAHASDDSRFVGTYIAEGQRLDIVRTSNGLAAAIAGFSIPLSGESTTRFTASHRFIPGGSFTIEFLQSGDAMVQLGGTYAIFAPRYPVSDALPAAWESWLGSYRVCPRRASRYSDAEVLWTTTVEFENGLVLSSADKKVLLPLNETHARIMGGAFEGEIMERDSETGIITWASFTYQPED